MREREPLRECGWVAVSCRIAAEVSVRGIPTRKSKRRPVRIWAISLVLRGTGPAHFRFMTTNVARGLARHFRTILGALPLVACGGNGTSPAPLEPVAIGDHGMNARYCQVADLAAHLTPGTPVDYLDFRYPNSLGQDGHPYIASGSMVGTACMGAPRQRKLQDAIRNERKRDIWF